ncbi:MAG: protein kinase [Chloroflexi bacterium]|nr:protein kinase [Chloroflexota bacterium]
MIVVIIASPLSFPEIWEQKWMLFSHTVIIQSMNSEHIGRYQIQSRIGNGGMATVYLAYDPHFSRQVAIKVIPDHYLNEPQSRKRFQREAKAIAQLEHPAIVPVYDYGENKGRPYLVMRYMGGGSLKDWLTQDPLPLTTISPPIIKRIANALDAAHTKGGLFIVI